MSGSAPAGPGLVRSPNKAKAVYLLHHLGRLSSMMKITRPRQRVAKQGFVCGRIPLMPFDRFDSDFLLIVSPVIHCLLKSNGTRAKSFLV